MAEDTFPKNQIVKDDGLFKAKKRKVLGFMTKYDSNSDGIIDESALPPTAVAQKFEFDPGVNPWVINHELGRFPQIITYNYDLVPVRRNIGDIQVVDDNTVEIHWAGNIRGCAIVS
jgi:hypothetical protein